MKCVRKFIGPLVVAMLLCSCAAVPQQKEVLRRYTWPQSSDEPKIEWIGVYGSSKQLNKGGSALLTKFVGEENVVTLDRPIGVVSNGKGQVIVSDVGQGKVLEFDFVGREVHRYAGDSLTSVLQRPFGLGIDGKENVYVADDYGKKIFVVGPDKKINRVIDLSTKVTSIGFFAIDKARNHLVMPDPNTNKVHIFDLNGREIKAFGQRGFGDGEFNRPNAVAIESDGTIVVADSFNARIQRFTPEGVFKSKFGKRGDAHGEFALIKGIAVDSEDHIYITDGRLNRVTVYSKDGVGLMTFGDTISERFTSAFAIGGFLVPQAIYIDQFDRIYIADQYNNRFQVFQYLNADYLKKYPLTGPARPMFQADGVQPK